MAEQLLATTQKAMERFMLSVSFLWEYLKWVQFVNGMEWTRVLKTQVHLGQTCCRVQVQRVDQYSRWVVSRWMASNYVEDIQDDRKI